MSPWIQPAYSTRRPAAPSALEGMQLLFYFLDPGMAHILAVHQVDQVFAHVLGVIAVALQLTHHPHDIERTSDRARILHHEGNALPVNGPVFLIHRAVAAHPRERQLAVETGK